jgi:ABC-type molybdenum transport system ATPase subunit/photorepair protein PhrA/GNAT superfamily N-acetyltransferase
MKTTIHRDSQVDQSPRVLQLSGLFDVPLAERSVVDWTVDIPLEDRPWHVGLIVGPSGCGKSTIARALWPEAYVNGYSWPDHASIIDGFPEAMPIKDVTMLLSSVGFSSPPSWVRPFRVLSNGEQFRATLARALAEKADLCVFDEFTSVVDRTVGRIGSAAVAKTVRRRKQKFIAVTCHDDVVKWLDPDWIYTPADAAFRWRLLRGRPPIDLDIRRAHHSVWSLFAPHHYLTAELSKSATCYVAYIDDRPVAFHSYLPFVGRLSHGKAVRGHRSVVLPDYQGVGIGNVMITILAGMWMALGRRVFRNTGHPAEIAGALRDPAWRLIRAPSRTGRDNRASMNRRRATNRLTASFEYVGKPMDAAAAAGLSAPL